MTVLIQYKVLSAPVGPMPTVPVQGVSVGGVQAPFSPVCCVVPLPFEPVDLLVNNTWQARQAARFARNLQLPTAEAHQLVGQASRGMRHFCAINDGTEIPDTVPTTGGPMPPRASLLLSNGLPSNADRLDRFALFMHDKIQAGEIALDAMLSRDEDVLERLEDYACTALGLKDADEVVIDVLINEYVDVAWVFEDAMGRYHALVSARTKIEALSAQAARVPVLEMQLKERTSALEAAQREVQELRAIVAAKKTVNPDLLMVKTADAAAARLMASFGADDPFQADLHAIRASFGATLRLHQP